MGNLQPDPSKSEPLAGVGAVTAAVSAVLGMLVTFGMPLTPAETGSILTAIAAVAPIVVWAWGRRKVFSPAMVHMMLAARKEGQVIKVNSKEGVKTDGV